ncbi:MAG TPA: GPR1/FUN34/YaaH family transporter [Mycobacteriales bacterium]|nr:GPR1/FUN34/YaaH family transporter [Mycobacteriales bacterium]
MSTVQDTRDTGVVAHTVEAPPAPPAADPSLLGLPVFIAGSLALGFSLIDFLPAAASAGILPIVMFANGLGLVLATAWAISLGQSVVASIFGVFAGFWLSYAALVLGLTHGWFAITGATNISDTVGTFLLCWTLIIGVLTVATLRLPSSFTLLLALVTLALALVTFATFETHPNISKLAGYVVFAFAANGVYLFLSATTVALGGRGYPLGRAVLR